MENEIWKDVIGYEGLYQVSNLGRVKSLPKKTANRFRAEIVYLKQQTDIFGYRHYVLSKNSVSKKIKTHRIIAEAFIKNKHNKSQINHINGIKHDNRIENLEWCSQSENQKHAYILGLQKSKKGADNVLSKKVNQYDLEGKFIKTYGSAREAGRITKIDRADISKCAVGKKKTAGGFVWDYE